MKRVSVFVLAVLLFVALAVPAVAGHSVGDRLSLFGGTVPPAGAAFHVAHGFEFTPGGDDDPGRWDFVLLVDGVPVADTGKEVIREGSMIDARRLYNFPDGLTGVRHFEGFWYQSCRSTDLCDPSDPPGSLVQVMHLERLVDFGS